MFCVYSLSAMSESDDEVELVKTFIKTCRAARDPRNPRSRPSMAVQAARWEVTFAKRLEELKRPVPSLKSEPEEVHA
jgi:hypothetical protein